MATKQTTKDTAHPVRVTTLEFQEETYLKAKAFSIRNRIMFKHLVDMALVEYLKKAA